MAGQLPRRDGWEVVAAHVCRPGVPWRRVHAEPGIDGVAAVLVGRPTLNGDFLFVVGVIRLLAEGEDGAITGVGIGAHEGPDAAVDVGVDGAVVLVEYKVARGIMDDGRRGAGNEREDE